MDQIKKEVSFVYPKLVLLRKNCTSEQFPEHKSAESVMLYPHNIIYILDIYKSKIQRKCLGGPGFSHLHISTYLDCQASCLHLLIDTGAALFRLP